MKILKTLIVALVLTASANMVTAQGQYDVRFNNVNCNNGKMYIDIEVKATEANSTFNLSEQNYRFTFNKEAIANPSIAQELKVSGQVSNSLYSTHSLKGSKSNIVSYNVELAGGEGYIVNDDWVGVGRVAFDVVDVTQCLDLNWRTSEQFPPTFIGKTSDDSRRGVKGDKYEGLSTCDFCEKKIVTEAEVVKFDVFPNPALDNDHVTVSFNALEAQDVTLIVTDILGKKVYAQPVNLNEGPNFIQLRHRTLETGTYLVQINNGGEITATKKFVKLGR